MTLRTKFVAFASLSVGLSVLLSAGGLWLMERRYLQQAALKKARTIEDSVEKAALDALLLEDTLSLVSYLRFLRRSRQ